MAEIRSRGSGDDADQPPRADADEARTQRTTPRRSARTGEGRRSTGPRVDRRRILIIAVIMLALLVIAPPIVQGVRGGLSAAGGADVTPTHTSTAAPTQRGAASAATHWRGVIVGLDAARARAIVARDAGLLGAVDAPVSAALRRDRAIITSLRRDGLRADAVPLRVLAVRELATTVGSSARRTILEVEDVMDSYTLSGSARLVQVPERARTTWRVELRDVPGAGWRYSEITRRAPQRAR